jgi:isoleucyl-tRNA synthetase
LGAQQGDVIGEYDALFAIRSEAQKLLEAERREKRIGASLEAKLVLGAEGQARKLLEAHRAELPGLFIVSQVELLDSDAAAPEGAQELKPSGVAGRVRGRVLPADGRKCPRCWTYSEAVGRTSEVCEKCREALR